MFDGLILAADRPGGTHPLFTVRSDLTQRTQGSLRRGFRVIQKDFVIPVRVYYEDTDAGGIVYYANYLKFMERARTERLRALGYEQDRLRAESGVLFAVTRAEIDYLRPARFNDLLSVSAKIAERGRARLLFLHEVRAAGDPERVFARGGIRVACVDAATLRPRAIPKPLFENLQPDDE